MSKLGELGISVVAFCEKQNTAIIRQQLLSQRRTPKNDYVTSYKFVDFCLFLQPY